MADNGYFRLLQKKKLSEISPEDKIPESDFACVDEGYFIQMEYVENEQEREKNKVHPGIFSIIKTIAGLKLEKTEFSKENLYADYIHTAAIMKKIDNFFNKVHIYKKHKIDPARRGMLLYGPPGCGKSQVIRMISEKYGIDNSLIVLWQTDKFDPYEIKEFIKSFEYHGVERFILIAEDIGGVEIDQVKMKSQSSLLALLDNTEKAFSIPTYVVATTNFPEIFLENLTKRPGRFDDLIEIPRPTGEQRIKLYNFYVLGTADASNMDASTPEDLKNQVLEMNDHFGDKKFNEFSIAHIREIILRSELYDLTHLQAAEQILADIKKFNNAFQNNKKSLGIMNDYD